MTQPSEKLRKWALEGLKLGFECISEGDTTPFVLLLTDDGEQHLINLQVTSGVIDESILSMGRELIREFADTGCQYGLVWDGYLTTGDEKSDAVFIEAGTREDRQAFMFAQKYRVTELSTKIAKNGRPQLVSDTVHLWGPSMTSEEL